jgi:alkylation response protein AidB-like acyl-CoA dehydrogenase
MTAVSEPDTPAEPGFVSFLDVAATPWRRLPNFPSYEGAEQRAGDELVDVMAGLVADVDPVAIDRTAALPDGLIEDLRAAGFLALRNDAALGGRAASDYNAFRVVERASRCSAAIGQLIAVQNGIGVPALLPSLPEGPLRDIVARYVRDGAVSGCSDTEPGGQNNRWRETVAVPTQDGRAYLLTGSKRFTSNAPVAGPTVVTAVVKGDGAPDRLGLVFLDLASAGVTLTARHDFLGSRGLPNGSVSFDAVRVPAEQVLAGDAPAKAGQPPSVGRLLINAAPALAIARECRAIAHQFVAERTMDGRPLGDYEQIQRFLATTMAEIHAMDSVVRWSLLGRDRGFEQALAKNICTVAAWEIADRTLSVLGGVGLETAASKLRRGAPALPVEQLLRDARGLRVAGNVDFMVDVQAGRALLVRHAERTGPELDWTGPLECSELSPANREHAARLVADLRRLSGTCARLARTDVETVPGGEQTQRLIGRIAGVLLGELAVLARNDAAAAELTDLHCITAGHRLAGLWHELAAPPRDFGRIIRSR